MRDFMNHALGFGFLVASAVSAASAQPTAEAPKIGLFVLYAERSVMVGDNVTMPAGNKVVGGAVGVRTAIVGGGGAQLAVQNSRAIGNLFAPSVRLSSAAVEKVWTYKLTKDLKSSLGTESEFPAWGMPPLPLAVAGKGKNLGDITVEAHTSSGRKPGNYGIVTLKEGSQLVLEYGEFTFTAVIMKKNSRLLVRPGGVDVRIVDKLYTDENAVIGFLALGGIAPGTRPAEQFTIAVAGGSGKEAATTGSPHVTIGPGTRVHALVAAPHGGVLIKESAFIRGAIAGFDIEVQKNAVLILQNGFPEAPPSQQGSQQLSGYAPYPTVAANVAPLAGPVPPDTTIALSIALPVRNRDGLTDFLEKVSDPTKPEFRKFLSEDAFNATYGADTNDYQRVQDWATTNGFKITGTYKSGLLLTVTGTAAQIQQALYVNLVHRLRKDGSKFVAVDREPSLDLQVPILEIDGLTDFVRARHAGATLNGTGTAQTYQAADLRNAYLGVNSVCQPLDGTGERVGIVGFDVFSQADIKGYDGMQVASSSLLPTQPGAGPNVIISATEGGNPSADSNFEATIDVEMVRAMAPNAQIFFFQGSTGITGDLDAILATMANFTPALTVASSSLIHKGSKSSQQSLQQMAARGTAFFTASGDYGDVGDPQNNLDMDYQTLVGGTFLSTNPILAPLPTPSWPNPYHAGETTWNGGAFQGKNATGGGIMNGINANGYCDLFCGDPVKLPNYQVGFNNTANFPGSLAFRNYPDVAMVATNVEIFFNGTLNNGSVLKGPGFAFGTSLAAPLWAGFTALVNQQRRVMAPGPMGPGFLNPALYAIGFTRGSAADLYATSFNDINDGVSNYDGFAMGHTSGPGYDLATGWGSPTCQLLNQLASPTPLSKTDPLVEVEFIFITGDDDLRSDGTDLCGTGSTLTADVFTPGGGLFNVPLHRHSDAEWQGGTMTPALGPFAVPNPLPQPSPVPFLSKQHGITGVTLHFQSENDLPFGCSYDNWDMRRLQVNLFTGNSAKVCQLNLGGDSGTFVRFKENADAGSPGTDWHYDTSQGSGCPPQ